MGCGGSLEERRKYSDSSNALPKIESTKSKKIATSSPKPISSCQLEVHQKHEVLPDTSAFLTIRVVGQGSLALVREVREKDKEKRYAMKVYPKDTKKLTEAKKTFMNMLNASKKMQHPFITAFVCAQQTSSSLRLVIELADKGDMRNVLKNVKREGFSDQMLRFYSAQLLCALQYVHSQGIVHRNVKPEAYLLDSNGFCKLSSFVYAKSVENGCKTYTLCGTPEYISPEILFNKGHGKPTDWWSFGVLVYEFLSGSPPFVAETPTEVYRQIMAGRYKFRKETPVSTRAFIGGLLKRDVSTRLGSQDGADEISTQAFWSGMSWQEILNSKVPANCEALNAASIPSLAFIPNEDEMEWTPAPDSSDPFKHTFGAFVEYCPTDYTRADSISQPESHKHSASLTKSSTALKSSTTLTEERLVVTEADVKVAYTQFISSNSSARVSLGIEEARPSKEANPLDSARESLGREEAQLSKEANAVEVVATNSSNMVVENPVPEADVVEANVVDVVADNPTNVGNEKPMIEADVGEVDGQFATSQACGGTVLEEKRFDPEDGKLCSYEEICAKYSDIYKPEEIEAYWKDECKRPQV